MTKIEMRIADDLESDVGHFSVKYTPKDMIGKVAMHVTLDGELIAGAPFLFDIEKCMLIEKEFVRLRP